MKNYVNVKDLGRGFMIFGNKGNVWSNTAHAYKLGTGNLCGTPALSANHAFLSKVSIVGGPGCLKALEQLDLKKV
jgi:hypothetical protein